MRSILCAAALLFAASAPAGAEQLRIDRLMTLSEALARAQTAGFDVRIARSEAEMASADFTTARSAQRPQLGISGVALDANEPQLGMPIARQAYGSVSLSVPLLAPQAYARARAASATARAALGALDEAANDAALVSAQAYRRVQLSAALLEARAVAVHDQEDHLRVTQARVASGKLARFTLLRDRAALALAVQAQEDAANERDQARNDFAALLDLDLGSQVVFEALAPIAFTESYEVVSVRALQQRPSLRAAALRVQAAEATVSASRDGFLPSVGITAQTYNGNSSPALGRSGGQVQLTATLALIDGGSRAAALRKAEAELARATAVREQIALSVQRDLANAFRELAAARKNLATAQAALSDAQEQVRIAQLREGAGKGIQLEVLDALSMRENARETVAHSLTRYDNAVSAVHHAAGDRTE